MVTDQRVRDGDEFEIFARARSQQLYRSAWLLCGNAHEAEDLVQETLAKVYVRWRRRFGGQIDNPAAYAQTVLVRAWIDTQRRRGSRERPVEAVPDEGVHDADAELRLALRNALDALEPLDRAVLVRRYLDDAPVADVAAELGISSGAVRNRSMRALERVRTGFGTSLSDLRLP